MLTFDVVREGHGWGIHMEQHMTTHFRRQDAAVHQAHLLAASIRRHGVLVAVTVQGAPPTTPPALFKSGVEVLSVHPR